MAFNAIIPLMTVVNYSVQEILRRQRLLLVGRALVRGGSDTRSRFHDALLRQILFTAIVLVIEVPLGLAIALAMPRRAPGSRSASC